MLMEIVAAEMEGVINFHIFLSDRFAILSNNQSTYVIADYTAVREQEFVLWAGMAGGAFKDVSVNCCAIGVFNPDFECGIVAGII